MYQPLTQAIKQHLQNTIQHPWQIHQTITAANHGPLDTNVDTLTIHNPYTQQHHDIHIGHNNAIIFSEWRNAHHKPTWTLDLADPTSLQQLTQQTHKLTEHQQ